MTSRIREKIITVLNLPKNSRSKVNQAVKFGQLKKFTGKLCFTQFSTRIYWNRSLADSDLFPRFIQSINFYTLCYHMLKGTDVWKNVINQCRQKCRVASFSI